MNTGSPGTNRAGLKRDKNGKIVTAYGPEDHSSPDQWKTVQLYRKLLRIAAKLPGTSPLLWD